ncbi:MAG: nucleotidyltransferase domain-containing protein [Melioribacteraceae bacterium]|nr:nucleotidyltransferase domain-containing protein [Melioribacteraceae bacterium]
MSEKKILSSDFQKNLLKLLEGSLSSSFFETIISKIEIAAKNFQINQKSESNLLRIISSIYDKISFFNDALIYPHHLEIICAISSNSNYLSDIVVRNPEYLYQLFDDNIMSQNLDYLKCKEELITGINKFKFLETKLNSIRNFKRRYILRIGTADILGITSLKTTTNELSILANAILSTLFELSIKEVREKYSISYDLNNYALCSLGKLGGNELNYSSDADFILFYENKEDEILPKNMEELLSEAAINFIKYSSEITAKGFVYRVDFRLRPDGKNSSLSGSINDYLRYYESRGEDWERQMLIKINFCSGDEQLYNRFINYIYRFIYPASFTQSPINQIKKMKENIERRLQAEDNVKLFSGGIRDIEFSVQALQMINGGNNIELRSSNTLEAINLLTGYKILSIHEAEIYTAAYIFYRRIEHFLQLMNNNQTHLIPSEGDILEKLARYTGNMNSVDFKNKLSERRKEVRIIFNSILLESKNSTRSFDKIKFIDHKRAEKNLLYLQSGSGLLEQKEFDKRTILLFSEIENYLFDYLRKSKYPDTTLENFVRFIKSQNFPSIWYNEFQNNNFLTALLKNLEYNKRGTEYLLFNKKAGEFLLTRRVFNSIDNESIKNLTLEELSFILTFQFTLRLSNFKKLGKSISAQTNFLLNQFFTEHLNDSDYFVATLGSTATGNMTLNSDIDLIIVSINFKKSIELNKNISDKIEDLKKVIYPFSVDFRLRPEGKSSQLIWDIENYKKYIKTRAKIWEFQALSKICFVSGNITLYNDFLNQIIRELANRDIDEIKREIFEMQKKVISESFSNITKSINLKKQKGGFLTLEFYLNYFIMTDSVLYKKALGKDFLFRLRMLNNLLGDNVASQLKDTFEKLKKLENTLQIVLNSRNSVLPEEKEKLKCLNDFYRIKKGENLNKEISELMTNIHRLFQLIK